MALLTTASGDVALIATTATLPDLELRGGGPAGGGARRCRARLVPPEFNGATFREWQRALRTEHPDEPKFAGW